MPLFGEDDLQRMGDHSRPLWLKKRQVKNPHSDHQELDVMRILAGRDMRGGRFRPQHSHLHPRPEEKKVRVDDGPQGADIVPPGTPDGATAHMKRMRDYATARQPVRSNIEFRRDHWLAPNPDHKRKQLHPAALAEVSMKPETGRPTWGTKTTIWGHMPTDKQAASWYVENQWALRAMKKAASDPSLIKTPPPRLKAGDDATDAIRKAVHECNSLADRSMKQPFQASRGTIACMVGGVGGGSVKPRNVGEVEDSYKNWRGSYFAPGHGLSGTDVTKAQAEILMCKDLARDFC